MTALDLTGITWQLDAYAGHWLDDDELSAVTDWMADNKLDRATAERPVIVENGTITYGQDRSPHTVRSPHRDIAIITVPLRTTPPKVWKPDCKPTEIAQLHEIFRQHEWSSGFGGVCVDCSKTRTDTDGRVWCHVDDAVQWPCRPVYDALTKAGIPVPTNNRSHHPLRTLGDCLNPDDNAKVFGQSAES